MAQSSTHLRTTLRQLSKEMLLTEEDFPAPVASTLRECKIRWSFRIGSVWSFTQGKTNFAPSFPKLNPHVRSPSSEGMYFIFWGGGAGEGRKPRRDSSLGTREAGMLRQRAGTRGIAGTSAQPRASCDNSRYKAPLFGERKAALTTYIYIHFMA